MVMVIVAAHSLLTHSLFLSLARAQCVTGYYLFATNLPRSLAHWCGSHKTSQQMQHARLVSYRAIDIDALTLASDQFCIGMMRAHIAHTP